MFVTKAVKTNETDALCPIQVFCKGCSFRCERTTEANAPELLHYVYIFGTVFHSANESSDQLHKYTNPSRHRTVKCNATYFTARDGPWHGFPSQCTC
jgi:hypothetical protein